MPTSEIDNVPAIIKAAMQINPQSVLDLGAGSGKYGVLLREYLDIGRGRPFKEQWKIKIHAVEAFHRYINNLHTSVYDLVSCEDFSDATLWPNYKGYELALLIDSLEHLPKERGDSLLRFLIGNNKNVIVSVPFGDNYFEQGAVYGNEYERHRAHWKPHEFLAMGGTELYRGVCCVYLFRNR